MEEEDEEPIPTESYESEAAAQAAAEQQLPILAEARVPVQRHLEPAIQAAAAADLTATTEGVLAGWGALFGFVPARVSASSHKITSALSFISERHIRSFRLVSSQVSVLEEASTVAEPAAASALVILPGRGDTTVAIPCEPIPRYPGDLRPSKRPRPFYLGKTQVNPGACVAEPATLSYFVAGEVLSDPKAPTDGCLCLAALAGALPGGKGQRPEAFTWAVFPVTLELLPSAGGGATAESMSSRAFNLDRFHPKGLSISLHARGI